MIIWQCVKIDSASGKVRSARTTEAEAIGPEAPERRVVEALSALRLRPAEGRWQERGVTLISKMISELSVSGLPVWLIASILLLFSIAV
ncbi:hypothetical protein [Streptomyces turgidiscabies]|uniref:Uncharacterized protein n=1 Tax=Streptomyces turgidiscabies TaxID=85558 RepID=A0ABU0S027_9ACTN|nr:hypothetical protein [Streptomyces turgidiscabies]MDQ0937597.1 hypothetical protein [Streptomyces turgidiscabies]